MPSRKLDSNVQGIVNDLVQRYGIAILDDRRRCEAWLRDMAAEYRREVNILVNALAERVPQDLLSAPAQTPAPLLFQQLAQRLEQHQDMSAEGARWAVHVWAVALGLAPDEEPTGQSLHSLRETLEARRADVMRLVEDRDKLLDAQLERGREMLPRVAREWLDRAPNLRLPGKPGSK